MVGRKIVVVLLSEEHDGCNRKRRRL